MSSLSTFQGGSLTTKLLRSRILTSGTTYTPGSDVAAFYAQIYGAVGGSAGANLGGAGGPGYSEKYYASPSGSYTYAIGAGGAGGASPTAGGTTTFDVMSVTGSGANGTTTGAAGGVGSGGDFNATGGTGGNYSGTSGGYGGSGGAGSRAGNGGNGGNGGGPTPGAGGGTGGNNASGGSPGTAATSPSGSAIVMPWGGTAETFFGGPTPNNAGYGAFGVPVLGGSYASLYGSFMYNTSFSYLYQYVFPSSTNNSSSITYPRGNYVGASSFGAPGVIVIIEVLK